MAHGPTEATHTIHIDNFLDERNPLVILLSLFSVTRYFIGWNPMIPEWEDDSIPNIDLESE